MKTWCEKENSMSALHRATLAGLGSTERSFVRELDRAPFGTSAIVFDVGANDGTWSKLWSEVSRGAKKDGKALTVY